jgi:hypothetical protein
VKMDHNKLILQKFAEKYQHDPLSTAALSLVSEMLARTGPIDAAGTSTKIQTGSLVIMQKLFAGETPADAAASFIEFLAQKLPS